MDCVKYLGVWIQDTGYDSTDMRRHKQYLYAKGNLLVRNFKCCSEEVKTKLFKTFCNNIYGGQLWSQYKVHDMHKLNVSFNDVFRYLFGVSRGTSISSLYVKHNIDSLNVLLRKAAFNFRKRLFNTDNICVRAVINSVYFLHLSSFTIEWNKILFM